MLFNLWWKCCRILLLSSTNTGFLWHNQEGWGAQTHWRVLKEEFIKQKGKKKKETLSKARRDPASGLPPHRLNTRPPHRNWIGRVPPSCKRCEHPGSTPFSQCAGQSEILRGLLFICLGTWPSQKCVSSESLYSCHSGTVLDCKNSRRIGIY